MNRFTLLMVAAFYVLALNACNESSHALEAKSAAAPLQAPPAETKGAVIRMSWPGAEDAPGLRGDIVTLTAFEGDTVQLTAIVEGADGKGIPEQTLVIVSTNGNDVANPLPVTGPDGRTQVSVTAKNIGKDTIRVSGAGARKTLTLAVRPVADNAQQNLSASVNSNTGRVEPHNAPILRSNPPPTLRALSGVVPWKTLADGVGLRLKNGVYQLTIADRVKALSGTHVKLQGFMLPLDQKKEQQHFLLTANPPTCFFCLPGGAESIVEVKCAKPVDFVLDPIIMSGRLEVVENHEFGLIYRMTQAQKVEE
jgi:hypothetical protein